MSVKNFVFSSVLFIYCSLKLFKFNGIYSHVNLPPAVTATLLLCFFMFKWFPACVFQIFVGLVSPGTKRVFLQQILGLMYNVLIVNKIMALIRTAIMLRIWRNGLIVKCNFFIIRCRRIKWFVKRMIRCSATTTSTTTTATSTITTKSTATATTTTITKTTATTTTTSSTTPSTTKTSICCWRITPKRKAI